ncbi:hypothetical protein BDQ17DRAFT_1363780 [Cyathus striatus]|nr:hypothetical protein BDQ17DRAFT_1363780 [Cyathus striatus]
MIYAAVVTSLMYDITYSFPDEDKYTWNGMKWSIPKFLYIISRYYCAIYLLVETILPLTSTTVVHISLAVCKATMLIYSSAGQLIITTSVDFIFMLRVNALYGNNRRAVFFLKPYSLCNPWFVSFKKMLLFAYELLMCTASYFYVFQSLLACRTTGLHPP